MLLGHDLRPVLAPRATILHAIEQCYYSRESSPDAFLRDLPATEANRPVGERFECRHIVGAGGTRYGNGHRRASGGTLPASVWNAFAQDLGFGEEMRVAE